MFSDIPLTVINTLSEVLASSKPSTDTKHVCCPPSPFSKGMKLNVLVNCNSLLTIIPIVDGDAKSCLSQLTLTRDGGTPSTTVTIQMRL